MVPAFTDAQWLQRRRLFAAFSLFALFSLLSEANHGPNEWTRFDRRVADALHAHAGTSPATVALFRGFTTLGNFEVLSAIGLAVLAFLLWRRLWRMALIWAVTLEGAGLLNLWLKGWFGRARPTFADPIIVAGGLSFPSGHAMNGLVVYGMLAYLLTRASPSPRRRVAIRFSCGALIAGVGISRIYLGAHWLSDVIAGWTVGTAWLLMAVALTHGVVHGPRSKVQGPKP